MKNIVTHLNEKQRNVFVFLAILCVNAFFYWGAQDNYFFSDDFEWLARAVLAQNPGDSLTEILRIEGRDFNPVFMILLTITIRVFGLSPTAFRLLSLAAFSGVLFLFFFILSRYFKVDRVIAFSAALLFGLNVYISEVMLNMAALVYSLSLLLLLAAVKFYLDGKRYRFLVFLLLAFLVKETVVLGAVPLLVFEKKKKDRLFLLAAVGGIGAFRVLLQATAAGTGKYTGFLSFSKVFVKLYYIGLKAMNVSPYTMNVAVGITILVLLLLVSIYFSLSKKTGETGRGFLFFFLFFVLFSLFLSLLPKLSSRYFFYPTPGFWGMAALAAHYFYQSNNQNNKKLKFVLVPLVLISMLFNYPFVKREIEDFRILGDFSKQFIFQQGEVIKREAGDPVKASEIFVYKLNRQRLAGVYAQIKSRRNLPKLLPFRDHSVGGVIHPEHLIPLVFYPGKIIRWRPVGETSNYFTGFLLEK